MAERRWCTPTLRQRPCDCPGAGWCERHKLNKPAPWVQLCQTNDVYWEAWEDGRGPGQLPHVGASKSLPVVDGGPGTELRRILKWFGIHDKAQCPCKAHARRMDVWGCDRCAERVPTIVAWLRLEAQKRHLPFSATMAAALVRLAIRRARKKQATTSG
jgi:hypothetical protein